MLELERGGAQRVQVRAPATDSAREVGEVSERTVVEVEVFARGPLPPLEEDRAIRQLEASAETHASDARGIGILPVEALTLDALARQAEHLMYEQQLLAAVGLMRQGHYVTVACGSRFPPTPEGFEAVTAGAFFDKEGSRVDLIVFVPDSSAAVAQKKREFTELREAAEDDYAGRFNCLPLEERERRWSRHVDAMKQIRDLRRNRGLNAEEREKQIKKLESLLLRRTLIMDRASLMLKRP